LIVFADPLLQRSQSFTVRYGLLLADNGTRTGDDQEPVILAVQDISLISCRLSRTLRVASFSHGKFFPKLIRRNNGRTFQDIQIVGFFHFRSLDRYDPIAAYRCKGPCVQTNFPLPQSIGQLNRHTKREYIALRAIKTAVFTKKRSQLPIAIGA
jgi:hypothetical protein